jgi:glycine/D-amino acid oxidase-like deaminating enzyme
MVQLRDIAAPGFKDAPYWWEAADPTAEVADLLPLPDRTDVAIVGGGYAGLSAALELRRGGVDCTVFDAESIGFGASSRNGGMISFGTNLGRGRTLADIESDPEAKAMLAESAETYAFLETLIRREGIRCHLQQNGRFVGAHTRKHYAELKRRAAFLERNTGQPVRTVPQSRQHEEIGSDYYRGGMVVERSGGLHPSLLHQGLAAACRRLGAQLRAKAAVTRIFGTRGDFGIETARGTTLAKEVVVATNGYTGGATPAIRRRLVPVASYIIATEELPEATVKTLFPTGRVIADTKRVLYYFRASPDGRRVIFGGRASFAQADAKASAPTLYRYMLGVFPQLKGVRITHAWNGNVAFTFDHMPHMGIRDGLHYCVGCNGSGVVMQTYLGYRTALKLIGGENAPSAFDGHPFPTLPFYRGNPWFLPVVGTWYRFRDRLDRWLD